MEINFISNIFISYMLYYSSLTIALLIAFFNLPSIISLIVSSALYISSQSNFEIFAYSFNIL